MFDKLIENLPKILVALTLRRAAYLLALSFTFTFLYAAYDKRDAIVDAGIRAVSVGVPGKKVIREEPATVASIKQIVNRSLLVAGIQLVNTDFVANTRTTAYFYSDRSDLQAFIDIAVNYKVAPTPLFMNTTIGTAEQREFAASANTRMISIISGDFVCYESRLTTLAKMAPYFPKVAPYLCSISIPPYPGKFAGYLNLFLTREPTDEEKDQLRDAARSLASDIFDRQIAR